MDVIFGVLWLVLCIKALIMVERPFLCAALYSIPAALLGFMTGRSVLFVGLDMIFRLGYTSFWFWLLDKFSESFLYWFILLLGIIAPFLIVLIPLIWSGR